MVNSTKVKRLILTGCLIFPLSLLPIKGSAERTAPASAKNSLYANSADKESQQQSLSANDKSVTMTEQKGGLYAPPPEGGEPTGGQASVGGNEIATFFLIAGVYGTYSFLKRRNKYSAKNF